MKKQISIALCCTIGVLVCTVFADDLGFSGQDLVEPDCDAMAHWFECRDIDTAPPEVFLGYTYIHETSRTLGPHGNVKYPDGEPYVQTVLACSSCHFTGGHVPFGSPVYQSPSKYSSLPYNRGLGYNRDLEDSIIDCFRNCMQAERAPAKDDPVMIALVDYITWVSEGIIDPAMREDWNLLPPEAGVHLPRIEGVSSMRANPTRGRRLYQNNDCASCHDEDGPGAGEYRIGEERPRVPALWGTVDGYSRAAVFYRTPVLAAYIQKHMPYGDPETLSDQQALDIAAYINAPDKPRSEGLGAIMYCHDDPDGIPSALRKPADWLIGCEYPGEREYFESLNIDYEDMVLNGPWDDLAAWRAAEIERLQGVADLVDLTMIDGTIAAGGLEELRRSDDQVLDIEARVTGEVAQPHLIRMVLGVETAAQSPSTMELTIESRITDIEASVWLLLEDWDGGEQVQVDTFTVGMTEGVHQVSVPNAGRFVRESDGRIELEVKEIVFFPFTLGGFHALIDHVQIRVD